MSDSFRHKPVMLKEVINILQPQNNKIYIDCTFGGGSYSKALLESCNCTVYGIDRDASVINSAKKMVEQYCNMHFIHGNFADIKTLLTKYNIDGVDGIVYDLGTSAMQIDDPERGFSFMRDGPLDMRMNNRHGITANDVVNKLPAHTLQEIIYNYGEEPQSRIIAKAIVETRIKKPINGTLELADIIKKSTYYKNPVKPIARTFQAIRIYVNGEIESLINGIRNATSLLNVGGCIVVVSFHGLECRVVKKLFKELTHAKHEVFSFRSITTKALQPGRQEIKINSRAASARLRAITKIAK